MSKAIKEFESLDPSLEMEKTFKEFITIKEIEEINSEDDNKYPRTCLVAVDAKELLKLEKEDLKIQIFEEVEIVLEEEKLISKIYHKVKIDIKDNELGFPVILKKTDTENLMIVFMLSDTSFNQVMLKMIIENNNLQFYAMAI